MAIGKWISNLKGLFNEGPLKELTEEVAEKPELKLSAENVVFSSEFNQTFNVESPVRENMRNSFMFSMLVMASHIVIADGKVEPEEYQFLGKFLNEGRFADTTTSTARHQRRDALIPHSCEQCQVFLPSYEHSHCSFRRILYHIHRMIWAANRHFVILQPGINPSIWENRLLINKKPFCSPKRCRSSVSGGRWSCFGNFTLSTLHSRQHRP